MHHEIVGFEGRSAIKRIGERCAIVFDVVTSTVSPWRTQMVYYGGIATRSVWLETDMELEDVAEALRRHPQAVRDVFETWEDRRSNDCALRRIYEILHEDETIRTYMSASDYLESGRREIVSTVDTLAREGCMDPVRATAMLEIERAAHRYTCLDLDDVMVTIDSWCAAGEGDHR